MALDSEAKWETAKSQRQAAFLQAISLAMSFSAVELPRNEIA